MMTEKIELLGKGLYPDIPNVLTIKSLTTSAELDYVGSEEFQKTMLEKIFPSSIEEKINFYNLLEIDFHWLCRGLRFLNYGPFHTTNTILCGSCGATSRGEYQTDLRSVNCIPLPDNFVNDLVISKDEFLDFKKDIHVKLLTIKEVMNCEKDTAFVDRASGKANREYARLCYMITSIGNETNLTPIQVRLTLEKEMSSADYLILKTLASKITDYGLRAGGTAQCPKCGNKSGVFMALVDDRFFRPTLGDLREWKRDRSTRKDENSSGNKAAAV